MNRYWTLLSVGLLTACSAGSGEGLDQNGRPLAENPPPPGPFATIQNTIFTPVCTGCHAGAGAPRGLRLDAGNSFDLLVGVPSDEVPALLRVDPGNPGASYLVQKIEGTAAVGGRMPLGGPPLPAADILLVRQWITDGALPDTTTLFAGAAKVRSASPAAGATLDSLPTVVIGFTQPLDASTVHEGSFSVIRSMDGRFGNGDDRAATVEAVGVSADNPNAAYLRLGATGGEADTYRIVLKGTGPSPVLDIAGRAVDGSNAGAGSDYSIEFDVVPILPNITSIQSKILDGGCADCHGRGDSMGLNFEDAWTSFHSLVNVPSPDASGGLRVEPGQALNSLFYTKLAEAEDAQHSVDEVHLDGVRRWIQEGAAW